MWRIVFTLWTLMSWRQLKYAAAMEVLDEQTALSTENFQINFLNELSHVVDKAAQQYLNGYLKTMHLNGQYQSYAHEFEAAQSSAKVEPKMVFIKQLLDAQHAAADNNEGVHVLRNVNFIKRVQQQVQAMQEESAQEVRKLRAYQLCKQFSAEATKAAQQAKNMAPMQEPAASSPTNSSHQMRTMSLAEFGRNVYERVKVDGSHIIDDYLNILRKLLYEVVEEKPEQEKPPTELLKVLDEIDIIINATDFYEKRQRLYGYLEGNLAIDFERFRSSDEAQQDLNIILAKLKERGMDLFFHFLFSNFEFLEHLHEEWGKLLQPVSSLSAKDEDSKLLCDIHSLYEDFKKDSEDALKYEAYTEQVKVLFAKIQQSAEKVHIYELLHNASQNFGSGTLQMIKSECNKL